ncbi:MAG: hypothetical protein ACK4TL_01195 [Hyphomicrobiaceae bacterium]
MSGQTAYPTFASIEERIDAIAMDGSREPARAAAELLAIGERVLEAWIRARGEAPTDARREGFRLLALHRQGARGEPSFNACRETCRELVYHYNLIALEPDHPDTGHRLTLAAMIARHLTLFVGGKLEVAGLGAFCCSSRPLRAAGH